MPFSQIIPTSPSPSESKSPFYTSVSLLLSSIQGYHCHLSKLHIYVLVTEAEDIKKRWQEYMEELYKKNIHNPDNHDDVITNLEPDIMECEVKWALKSITTKKLVGVMEFQLNYFKS